MLHVILPHLGDQASRGAVRLVCTEWRAAADAAWTAGALDCMALPFEPRPAFRGSDAFLLPRLHELCLVQILGTGQLRELLPELTAARMPALRRLVLASAPDRMVLLSADDRAQLAPQLQLLQLDDIVPAERDLLCVTRLHHLTSLALSLTDGGMLPVSRVSALASLRHLQVQEEEREALSCLTRLTSLAFTAAGKGAVGLSLLPLARLQHLHIALAHTHEHFLVLHPRLDWAQLRRLTTLTSLHISHLAATTFFAAPEVTWSDEAPTEREADRLVAALPRMRSLHLRLSYCQLLEEHATEGPPQELSIPSPDGDPRRFLRTIQRVPVRAPGRRRPDSHYAAWWQPALQARLAAAADAAPDAVGIPPEAAQRYLAAAGEVAGWSAIRAGSYRTFDVLVVYESAPSC